RHPMVKQLLVAVALGAAACRPATPEATVPPEPRETRLSNVRQLTDGGENAEAYFNRDGSWITFQSTRDGRTCDQQYVMRADGTGMRRISDGRGKTTCGWFSAVSDRIFFASTTAHDET